MCHSKALWDTSSSSHKRSKCPKHSSNRYTCSTGSTNIPKTRLAALQTSGICWLGSAAHHGGALRCALLPCGQQHVLALGSWARRRRLGWECLKYGKLAPVTSLLTWICWFRVRQCRSQRGEERSQRLRLWWSKEVLDLHHQPATSAANRVDCRTKWIIKAVEKKRRFSPNIELTSQCVFCTLAHPPNQKQNISFSVS